MDELQYIRRCNLILADASGGGLDVSNLRIVFKIKRSDYQTPNAATIVVYNLNKDTAKRVTEEFKNVTLQAGYESNYGVIFNGNIKHIHFGRENGTDTYLHIEAADGDQAYNFATINATLASGSTARQQIDKLVATMNSRNVTEGFIETNNDISLPRGKSMFGMSRKYLKQLSDNTLTSWSIQNGKVQFVSLTGTLPTTAVVLNSRTGLIGTPEQTIDGIKVRCLLNPNIKIGARIQINENQIRRGSNTNTQSNEKLSSIADDGFYRVLVNEYVGDTRGNDWYNDIICLAVDETAPPNKRVRLNG